jgi:hypothetical protein
VPAASATATAAFFLGIIAGLLHGGSASSFFGSRRLNSGNSGLGLRIPLNGLDSTQLGQLPAVERAQHEPSDAENVKITSISEPEKKQPPLLAAVGA